MPKKVAITTGVPLGTFKIENLRKMATRAISGEVQNDPLEANRNALRDILINLNSDIAKVCSHSGTVGLSIAVLYEGKPLLYSNFGHRNLEPPLMTTEHTIYHLGALGQFITSYAIGLLVKEGRLQWDDPIKLHLDEFKHFDESIQNNLTITDCLSHQTGLAAQKLLWLAERGRINIEATQIFASFSDLDVLEEPRTYWCHNDWGYAIIGKVIEKVSGQTWGGFLQTRIFDVWGLQGTNTNAGLMLPNTATGYMTTKDGGSVVNDRPEVGDGTCMAGAHGIQSTAHDLLWMYKYILEDLHRPADKRLGPDLDMLTRKHADIGVRQTSLGSDAEQSYSLGWIRTDLPDTNTSRIVIGDKQPNIMLWHQNGEYPGFACASYILPDIETAVVVLSNSTGKISTPDIVSKMIIETILQSVENGAKPIAWVKDAKNAAESLMQIWDALPEELERDRPNRALSLPLVDYVGKYANEVNTWYMEIWYAPGTEAENEALWMCMQGHKRETVQRYKLTHYYQDVFTWLLTVDESAFRGRWPVYDNESYLLKFVVDENFRVTGVNCKRYLQE